MTPDFLIIGAMKAGTTTLYRDLCHHPDIFMPPEKEPETLVKLHDDQAVLADYSDLFAAKASHQKCGEASTAYTKRPLFEGVAERAMRLLGPDTKIIYIRREPYGRMISHYKHDCAYSLISTPFPDAIRSETRLIDYSCYDWQIAPWLATFGESAVLQLDLDSYSAARRETVLRVLAFIGVDPEKMPAIELTDRANRAEEAKTLPTGFLRTLIASHLYQRTVKPLIPDRVRERFRTAVLPAAEDPDIHIDNATRAYIEARMAARNEAPSFATESQGL